MATGSVLVTNSADTFSVLTPGNGQSIRRNASTGTWEAFTPATADGGVTSVGAIDTSPNGNGLYINGTTIYTQTAGATSIGMVSTGAQTFAGAKTFSSPVTITQANLTTPNLLSISSNIGNISPASTNLVNVVLATSSVHPGTPNMTVATFANQATPSANVTKYGVRTSSTGAFAGTSVAGEFSATGGTAGNYAIWATNGSVRVANLASGSAGAFSVVYADENGVLSDTAVSGAGTFCLQSANGGAPTWGSCGSAGTTRLDQILAATNTNSINSGVHTQTWAWGNLAANTTGFTVSSGVSTVAPLANQKTMAVNMIGTDFGSDSNATSTAFSASNTKAGPNLVNIGATFSASGGGTNYGLLVTSGQVGINTSSPLANTALDVNGVIAAALGTSSAPSHSFRTDLNTGMWSSAADTLNFSTGGSEVLRMTSANRVGIGTTNPLSLLQIGSGGQTKQQSYDGIYVNPNGTEAQISIENNAGLEGGMFVHNTNLSMYIGTWSNHALRFRTNNSDKMIILSNGNVGIGNTSPAVTLDVSGTIRGTTIGVGTSNPQSGIQAGSVNDSLRTYIQIDSENAAPPATDCDVPAERGRMVHMVVPGVNFRLYICTYEGSRGWDYVDLIN